jgi:glutamate-1-semialdehyde 2,1-aminomutase
MFHNSQLLFERAQRFIPGGVNSPVRAFKSVGGTPVFMQRAQGAYLFDEDGNHYIDYIASWGPMILGHAYEPVVQAVREHVLHATSFGTPTALEIEMAELIISMTPNVDLIRMVNSGTEACMSAVRLARGYTGRSSSKGVTTGMRTPSWLKQEADWQPSISRQYLVLPQE